MTASLISVSMIRGGGVFPELEAPERGIRSDGETSAGFVDTVVLDKGTDYIELRLHERGRGYSLM